MKFTAKASSALTHHHRTVSTHGSINKDDYYAPHFSAWVDPQGAEPWQSESLQRGKTRRWICLMPTKISFIEICLCN